MKLIIHKPEGKPREWHLIMNDNEAGLQIGRAHV